MFRAYERTLKLGTVLYDLKQEAGLKFRNH